MIRELDSQTPGSSVPRERVLTKLARRGIHQVNLVVAPAGFGKTTTVRQWLELRGEPVAWVAISPDDNDPFQIWSRIIDSFIQEVGSGVRAKVALENAAVSIRPTIERIAESFSTTSQPVNLVLDDFHLILNQDCLESVELAIDLFPPQVRLILVSRNEPDLPFARYKGRGQLLRVGVADLAFDQDEALSLLVDHDRDPSRLEATEEIWRRTGGWPAALYISNLWLQDHPEAVDASSLLPERDERIVEFLMSEVIGALEPEVREFLRTTSFLDWMSGKLCDEVCGFSGSAEMLESICRSNQLVERDRNRSGWFRYHGLMRKVLLEQFAVKAPDELQTLRRSAIEWYLREGMIDEAAETALAAGEHQYLAEILAENHFGLGSAGRVATLWRWGCELPGEILDQRPDLCLIVAMAGFALEAPFVELRRLLARASKSRETSTGAWTSHDEVFWSVLNAFTSRSGLSSSIELFRDSIAAAKDMPSVYRSVGKAYLASYLEMAGDLDEAERIATEAIEGPGIETHAYGLIAAVNTLALVAVSRVRPHEAEKWAGMGHEAVQRFGLHDTRTDAVVQMVDARVAVMTGNLGRAGRSAEKALEIDSEEPVVKARLLLVGAQVRALRGQRNQAEAALSQAEEVIATCPDVGSALDLNLEVQSLLAQGRLEDSELIEPLTNAELRILPLLERGHTRAEIAAELFLSVNTVKTHLRSIYRKLGASSREDAVARAALVSESEGAGVPSTKHRITRWTEPIPNH